MAGDERRSGLDRVDAWVGRRSWLADPVLAVALAVLFAPGSIRLIREGGLGSGWTDVLIAAVVVLHAAVVFRRRAPRAVFVTVAAAELVLAVAPGLADPQGGSFSAVLLPSSLSYLVGAYTVSARTERPWPLVSLLVGLVGAAVATVRIASTGAAGDGSGPPSELLSLPSAFLAAVVAAWALGRFRRLRTDQVAALAARARAAEADREQRDRQAAADERARIARELHDVVAHSVSVMVRQAEAGRYVSRKDPAAAATALATIADIGREALTDMRALLGVLRPEGGSPTGPQPTLDDLPDLLDRVRASGLPVGLHVDGRPRPLDRAAHLAAYRLVQEALTNVVKHAGAGAQAEVTLSWSGRWLRLRVSDTGSAALPPAQDSPGGGLLGMRERVQLAGGRLRAGPTGDAGFAVEAELPVTDDRAPS
ncbi:sensor histidine kinase [Georgenia sp. H159]|uniref:sensor histidine kinase n=1 Tax=Georgenia sp. H159 TaxID=3076115 RepID=UPI002D7759CB|nr:histidine kinase [Georgenia sp. H159]